MNRPYTSSRLLRLAVTVAACACTLAVAACGGSGGSSGTTGNSKAAAYQSFLSFSKCMRAHGVKNFPDPSTQGGGIKIADGRKGVDPSAPAFQSAQRACQHLLPAGGPSNHKPTEQEKRQGLALAQCMRAHGLTNFPDPTTTPPSRPSLSSGHPGGPGGGAVLGINGLFFNLGAAGVDPSSPAFKQAAVACHFPGAGRLGGLRHPPAVTKG